MTDVELDARVTALEENVNSLNGKTKNDSCFQVFTFKVVK